MDVGAVVVVVVIVEICVGVVLWARAIMSNVFQEQLSSWQSRASLLTSQAAESVNTSFFSRFSNPFENFGSGGLRLPTSNRASPNEPLEEPSWFTMSRWDRLLVFGACLAFSALLFTACFALLPVLAVKPRKFATIWSLASLLFVISFGVLQGPVNYLYHLFGPNRILFTIAYFGSIIFTLISSLALRSTILTVLAVIIQILAALWYTISYFPMGSQSLRFASRVGANQVSSWLNL